VNIPWLQGRFQAHGDPFDRMLIAQGQLENLPIETSDPVFKQYRVSLVWQGVRVLDRKFSKIFEDVLLKLFRFNPSIPQFYPVE